MSVMLVVADFWAWKHMAQTQRLVHLQQDYGAGLIQGGVHTELKSTEREAGLVMYHGVGVWKTTLGAD